MTIWYSVQCVTLTTHYLETHIHTYTCYLLQMRYLGECVLSVPLSKSSVSRFLTTSQDHQFRWGQRIGQDERTNATASNGGSNANHVIVIISCHQHVCRCRRWRRRKCRNCHPSGRRKWASIGRKQKWWQLEERDDERRRRRKKSVMII